MIVRPLIFDCRDASAQLSTLALTWVLTAIFMGVHGLTSYLRERKRLLSRATLISSAVPVPVVVDGWS